MGVRTQHDGNRPRGVFVEPLLPEVIPLPTYLGARQRQNLQWDWRVLSNFCYHPEANIIPLDPTRLR
jgi:hypothetical protein